VANPTDALLTMEELVAIRQEHKVYEYTKSGLSTAICAAQHRKTLQWVANMLPQHEFHLGAHYDQKARLVFWAAVSTIADELRALADGRGEG
jgi:hypothetical protein